MKILRIKETCLYVKDLDATESFYSGKLGLEQFAKREGSHVFFRAGESVLLCFLPEASLSQTRLPPHGTSGITHYAFEVSRDEYPLWRQKLLDERIDIIHEEKWPGGYNSFYFRDPDGHVGEFIEEGMWEV